MRISPTLLKRAAGLAALPAAGLLAWEAQRRLDARRIAADPETAALQQGLEGRSVEVRSTDGTRVHAEVFGPEGAPTIVLAHGWMCALRFWHYQIHDLATEYRVVAYDQRGHGRSDAPHAGDYSSDALGADLQAVLDACVPRGERCVLAGHSMGGMSIVAWAGRRDGDVRRRVAAAALISTGMGELASHAMLLNPRWMGGVQRTLARNAVGLPLWLPHTSTPVSYRAIRYIVFGPRATPGRVAFCEQMILACPAPVRRGFGRQLSALDLYEFVPRLRVPTLVMTGEADRLTPVVHAHRLAEMLPDVSALIELPAIGHMAPVEAPEVVTGHLRTLVRRHLGGSPKTAGGRRRRRDVPA